MSKLSSVFGILSKRLKHRSYSILLFSIIVFFIEMLGVGVLLPLLKILTDENFTNTMPKLANFISFFSFNIFENLEQSENNFIKTKLIVGGCVLIAITFFLKFIFLTFHSYLLLNYKAQIQEYLSMELLKKYSYVELEYYFIKNSSELIRNITSDVSHFSSYIMSILILITECFIFIGISIILISQQPINSLITLFAFSLIILVLYNLSKKKLLSYGSQRVLFEGERIKIINQIIEGFKEIKILGRSLDILNKFNFFNKKSFSLSAKIGMISASQRFFLEFFLVICLLSIIFIIISSTKNFDDVIYSIGLFAVVMFRLYPSFSKILSNLNNLRASRISVIKVFDDIMKVPNELEEYTKNKISFNKEININDISFKYKTRSEKVFQSLSLKIKKGEMIGFIGESGVGKSTFIEIMMGFLKPDNGKILIDGKDIFKNLREWRNQIGYVTQKNFIEDGTILSNIALGISENEVNFEKIKKCATESQLDNFIKSLEKGFDTKVGERGVQLSEGQRKRIAIARALYNDPEVIFLDEATSSLDKATEKEFLKIINDLKFKKTIIIITHDISTLSGCDKVYKIFNRSLSLVKNL